MPHDYEIMMAFRRAIKRDVQGPFTISTPDFVKELNRMNWRYSLKRRFFRRTDQHRNDTAVSLYIPLIYHNNVLCLQ